jgi:hypothetical protein
MDNMSIDRTIQTVQEQNFNSIKILYRHKMLLRRKTWMDIPLCKMISMPIVRFVLKINVLKMEQTFQIEYHEGYKTFYLFLLN